MTGPLTRWLFAPRRPGLLARAAIGVALQVGQAGFFLLVSYALITYPGKAQLQLDDQPTPSMMWQVGVLLAIVGALILLWALVVTPRVDPETSALGPFPLTWTVPVGMFVTNLVIAVVAAFVSEENQLRWWPLLLWAMSSGLGIYAWRRQR